MANRPKNDNMYINHYLCCPTFLDRYEPGQNCILIFSKITKINNIK